jgi:oxaloacetate decarboxylase
MSASRNDRFRAHLTGDVCIQPASVFDPVSVRIADSLGFPVGMFAGSVASAYVMGAPDIIVMTSRELADQARRITQVGQLSLMVDADHGFGNALNVMRTVTELESAGVSALSLEDSALPAAFGRPGVRSLISTEEMVRKLAAAVEARNDPTTVVIARTEALGVDGPADGNLDIAVERSRAYADTGADAMFLTSVETLAQVEAIRDAVDLPLVVGGPPPEFTNEDLAERGVRLTIRGHAPFQAYVQGIHRALAHQAEGRPASELAPHLASSDLMALVTGKQAYDESARRYLNSDQPT